MNRERAQLVVTALSPLHIGCDIDYEPTEYLDLSDGKILVFSLEQLAAVLTATDRSNLNVAASAQSPHLEIQKLLQPYAEKLKQMQGVRIIEKLCRNPMNWGKRASIRRIQRTAFDPLTERGLLPGSSLKGAIRTAWLAANAGSLLRVSIPQDPLRLLAVTDSFAEQESRALFFLKRPHKAPHRAPGSQSSVNFDFLLESNKTNTRFRPQIQLSIDPGAPLTCAIPSLQALIKSINSHYKPEFDKTRSYLEGISKYSEWLKQLKAEFSEETKIVRISTGEQKKVYTKLGLMNRDKGFLIRIGKHGGAESLTIPRMRKIKSWSPRTKTVYNIGETTLTMTLTHNNEDSPELSEPFGWAFVQVQTG